MKPRPKQAPNLSTVHNFVVPQEDASIDLSSIPRSDARMRPQAPLIQAASVSPPPELPPQPPQDLKPLLSTQSEPDDGRVSLFDAPRKSGWRKMEVTVDQQIPICKDYHDTGYCTFGPSCKFMHIRDDVLSSSQFDRKLALDAFKKSQAASQTPPEPSGLCPICGNAMANPVVANCGHKFCGPCAMSRYRENHLCAVCGVDTNGVFNLG